MSARTLGLKGGWIVMSHIGWGGEQTTIYTGVWKLSPSRRVLSFEGKLERERPKKTISASSGSGSLHMQRFLRARWRLVGSLIARPTS